jgi:L-2,4-diaminobutyrate decarboxylase
MMREEFAYVVPTSHESEVVARFVIVNPPHRWEDIMAILGTIGLSSG